MKKHMIMILTLLVLALLPVAAFATEVDTTAETTEVIRGEFQCGEDMEWLYDDGALIIVGTGEMDDYEKGQAPWEEYKKEITRIEFSGEISYIGSYAFYDYDALTEVEFGEYLYEIGPYAFYDCDGLTTISIPATFKVFGERCFSGSSKLAEIHCAGKFPSFRDSCLWDVYCKIIFPADKPWSVTYIQQLEEAFKGRIEFLASDGSDPYTPEEETEETTESTTEAITEATTEAATEATAEATTEAVTEPDSTEETVTQETAEATKTPETAATEPDTTEAQETEEETQTEEKKASSNRTWIAVVIVASVLVVLNVGALLFRKPRGGKYSNR